MKVKPGSFLYALGVFHHFWKLAGYPVNRYVYGVLKANIRVWQLRRTPKI